MQRMAPWQWWLQSYCAAIFRAIHQMAQHGSIRHEGTDGAAWQHAWLCFDAYCVMRTAYDVAMWQ
jgi:hypothetical protein